MVSSALDHNKPRVLVSGLSNGLGGTEIVVGRYIKALSSYATFEFLATSDLSDVAFVHEMNSEIHICPDIDRPIKRFEYLDHLFQDEPNRVDFQSQRNSLNGPRVSAASATRK